MQPVAHGTRRTLALCCWPECFHEIDHPDLPLCGAHVRQVGLRWVGDNIDLVRTAVTETPAAEVVLDDARRRAEQHRTTARWEPASQDPREAGMVVYYIRVRGADRVKIGTTSNLRQRMVSLRADGADLLATEPGGYAVERRRHQEFADERIGAREEFALSDRLAVHIADLSRGAHTPPA